MQQHRITTSPEKEQDVDSLPPHGDDETDEDDENSVGLVDY